MRFIISGRLPSLNDYTKANRGNKYAGNTLKQDTQQLISLYIPKWVTIEKPVTIEFRWYEQNTKRDLDNVAFAKKFILDALVNKGILVDDGWKQVVGFSDEFYVDKKNPRIEVDIHEQED